MSDRGTRGRRHAARPTTKVAPRAFQASTGGWPIRRGPRRRGADRPSSGDHERIAARLAHVLGDTGDERLALGLGREVRAPIRLRRPSRSGLRALAGAVPLARGCRARSRSANRAARLASACRPARLASPENLSPRQVPRPPGDSRRARTPTRSALRRPRFSKVSSRASNSTRVSGLTPMPSRSRPPLQHVDLCRLLGHQRRLPLREDHDAGCASGEARARWPRSRHRRRGPRRIGAASEAAVGQRRVSSALRTGARPRDRPRTDLVRAHAPRWPWTTAADGGDARSRAAVWRRSRPPSSCASS